jgi:hypothetical protein
LNKIFILFTVIISLQLSSCTDGDIVYSVVNPIQGISETPFLSEEKGGIVILSWTEIQEDTISELKFSTYNGLEFSEPKSVSKGTDWFVNWADCPSVVAFGDDHQNLLAHWLQKSANGTYDYDIRLSISKDWGNTWEKSFILHEDNIAAEHGFVTLKPTSKNTILASWLDGRNTKPLGQKDFNPKMTLRSAILNIDGSKDFDVELDSMVCDCCQTDIAIIENNPLVVYRDRTDLEIRDISLIQMTDTNEFQRKIVNDDSWFIAGCPVNGPRISSYEEKGAIVWYTESKQEPKINVAFINSSGDTINEIQRIDIEAPMGRVDVIMLNKETALVSWMEKTGTEATLFIQTISINGRKGKLITIGKNSQTRSSGFPVITKVSDQILIAYTLVDGDNERIETKSIHLKDLD